ncbi:unnamed protein product [Ilex paraguariensis]|uniref:Uncharacterized protein n=1 Tax=Ilex paraguariensis TaxID=185542 RepID=A0ABC8RK21_9AQUA
MKDQYLRLVCVRGRKANWRRISVVNPMNLLVPLLAMQKSMDPVSVLKSSPRRSPRREARRGELISPGGPQAKRT